MGSCLYDKGDIESAIRSFKYAIQLEPNFPDAYNNLGNALRGSGDLDEAILCYRAALRLKPDHPHAYNNLGMYFPNGVMRFLLAIDIDYYAIHLCIWFQKLGSFYFCEYGCRMLS
jgi:tetratricopeptide (TPR) repeat protein